jgi:hypothetical protein
MWPRPCFGHLLRCCLGPVLTGSGWIRIAPDSPSTIKVSRSLSMSRWRRMVSRSRSALNDGVMPILRSSTGCNCSGDICPRLGYLPVPIAHTRGSGQPLWHGSVFSVLRGGGKGCGLSPWLICANYPPGCDNGFLHTRSSPFRWSISTGPTYSGRPRCSRNRQCEPPASVRTLKWSLACVNVT